MLNLLSEITSVRKQAEHKNSLLGRQLNSKITKNFLRALKSRNALICHGKHIIFKLREWDVFLKVVVPLQKAQVKAAKSYLIGPLGKLSPFPPGIFTSFFANSYFLRPENALVLVNSLKKDNHTRWAFFHSFPIKKKRIHSLRLSANFDYIFHAEFVEHSPSLFLPDISPVKGEQKSLFAEYAR